MGCMGRWGRRRSVRDSCIRHRRRPVMASSSKRRRQRHVGDCTPVSPSHDVCLAASTRRLSVCLSFVLNARVCHSSSPPAGLAAVCQDDQGIAPPLGPMHAAVFCSTARCVCLWACASCYHRTGKSKRRPHLCDSLGQTAAGGCKRELTFSFAELPELPDARWA